MVIGLMVTKGEGGREKRKKAKGREEGRNGRREGEESHSHHNNIRVIYIWPTPYIGSSLSKTTGYLYKKQHKIKLRGDKAV